MVRTSDDIKSKLVVKAVRNVRRGYEADEAGRGMYRPDIRLCLQRSRLITESYKETEGMPMTIRRAKAFENVLTKMDLYIQPWEKIVGNVTSTPQGLYYGIEQNWRSVSRLVAGREGLTLLDDKGRAELADMIEYWKGRSLSDLQQEMFTGDILKYWKYEGTFLWSHWTEGGIPDYEKIFRVGLSGLIQQARGRLAEIDREVPVDYVDQKEFLEAAVISLRAAVAFARRYSALAGEMADAASDPGDRQRLEEISRTCARVPENPPRTFREALQGFFLIHAARYLEFTTVGIAVRFDKLFGPYYETDLRERRISREEAIELLQLLWVKFQELGLIYSPTLTSIYGGVASLQAITLGGVDGAGRDVSNELTYLVLETARTLRTLEPSIALRYHRGTPDKLLDSATHAGATGAPSPDPPGSGVSCRASRQ